MKIVLQRVTEACVTVDKEIVGKIGRGYLALVGVFDDDTKQGAKQLAEKISKLRIFPDGDGKTNLSALDVGGAILIVSQFTLCADCKKGNRPSFVKAANPEKASELVDYFAAECRQHFKIVQTGIFGAKMEVALVNDGPFTVVLEG
ncbi:MAG: D-aminoacyl-tRNA deacylase [Firmicutes bacterium]|nr:D-aminoacyl-tRNA deacylase [Bacillota bacterium]